MQSTQYLYGCNFDDFKSMSYEDALNFKISKAQELISKLSTHHYTVRDDFRITKSLHAIEFNQKLLEGE